MPQVDEIKQTQEVKELEQDDKDSDSDYSSCSIENIDDNNPPEAQITQFNPAEEIDYQKVLEETIENINIRLIH